MAGAGHVKGPTHAGPLSNIHPNGQSMQSPTPTGLSVNKPMPAIDKPMPAIDKPMPEIGKPMPELPSASASASRQTMLSDVSSSSSGTSPSSMSAASATRQNPLVELIESEKVYVEHLGLVIRRVAAAWSRTNFPPAPLDNMFRRVEAVYKANRAFAARLDEVGTNPSSPKALGDLLIQWVDDLAEPYGRYGNSYMTGFDRYPPITSNSALPPIIQAINASHPPPGSLPGWTVDTLFLLPYTRLRYYKKLYTRLLRSTKEGKSDHKLLLVANDRLDNLLSQVEARLSVGVDHDLGNPPAEGNKTRPPPVIVNEKMLPPRDEAPPPDPPPKFTHDRKSTASSAKGSSVDTHSNSIVSPFNSGIEKGDRTSGASGSTGITPIDSSASSPAHKSYTPITPIERSHEPSVNDLEIRLDTGRTIDLFSMNPKPCRLQMNPPSSTFNRQLRFSCDATVYFTPTSTGREVAHERAQIFVLSDLFLLCEQMSVSEKVQKAEEMLARNPDRVGDGGPMPEMWLCYPPLAGRHLSVISGGLETELIVTIMGRERFLVEVESRSLREELIENIKDCIEFEPPAPRTSLPIADPRNAGPSYNGSARSSPSVSPSLNGATADLRLDSRQQSPQPGYAPPMAQVPLAAPPPRNASLRARVSSNQMNAAYNGGPFPVTSRTPSPALNQAFSPTHEGSAPSPYHPHSGGSLAPSSSVRSVATARSLDAPGSRIGPAASFQHGRIPHASDPPMERMVRSTSPRDGRPLDVIPQGHVGGIPQQNQHLPRSQSADPLRSSAGWPYARHDAPQRTFPGTRLDDFESSPPNSPVEAETTRIDGPAVISAQMKCKVFLKQSHQQWKSLGSAKLRLYVQPSNNVKQLVVEADSSSNTMLISTIVLTDGVERVGKTGVAIELSDRGQRTGVVYMIQLRNEKSAMGLFSSLLAGSDRAVVATMR